MSKEIEIVDVEADGRRQKYLSRANELARGASEDQPMPKAKYVREGRKEKNVGASDEAKAEGMEAMKGRSTLVVLVDLFAFVCIVLFVGWRESHPSTATIHRLSSLLRRTDHQLLLLPPPPPPPLLSSLPSLAPATINKSMDPSPDPEHPPPRRSPWRHPSSSNGGTATTDVIDTTSWPALSEAARNPKLPSIDSPSGEGKHSPPSQQSRHKPARRGSGDHPSSPRDDRASWDHAPRHNGGGGRRGAFGGRRRGGGGGGFDALYRASAPPIGIGIGIGPGPYLRGAGAPPPPPPMAVAPPPFMGPPPPPMRPFAGPVVFHEVPSPVSPVSPIYYVGPPPPPEALRGLPFPPTMLAPPAYPYYHPSPQPQPDPEPEPDAHPQHHRANLLKQIEFYFSKDNLCTDVFLRRNMDDQGWVNIALIAGFNKVQEFTDDLQYIKDTIQSSSILEMQDDKIRRQNDWNKWVIPRESNTDVLPSPNINNLTANLGSVGLQESAASSSSMVDENHHEILPNGPTSSNNQAPVVEDGAGKL